MIPAQYCTAVSLFGKRKSELAPGVSRERSVEVLSAFPQVAPPDEEMAVARVAPEEAQEEVQVEVAAMTLLSP